MYFDDAESLEYIVFFFQAEDGIRDGHVTGVQTCALPIWSAAAAPTPRPRSGSRARPPSAGRTRAAGRSHRPSNSPRSEERRVGKEERDKTETSQKKTQKIKETEEEDARTTYREDSDNSGR